MENRFSRTGMLIGHDRLEKLAQARVLVFGVGGVGGYVCEALVRAGLGHITLVDNDIVSISNINRQIIATDNTLGRYKVDIMEERIHSINPLCKVETYKFFYLPGAEDGEKLDFLSYDYIVDAIDTVAAKLDIICRSKEANVRIISCMGTGNKLDNTKFEIADISKTSDCPLAKVIRRELRNRNIDNVKVLFSREKPIKTDMTADGSMTKEESMAKEENQEKSRRIPGSISFVPAVAGLIIGGEVVRELIE